MQTTCYLRLVKAIIKPSQDWDPYSFHTEQTLLNQNHNQAFANPRLCMTELYARFLSLPLSMDKVYKILPNASFPISKSL